ncbi:MAG: diaminopimelate epimerase [Micavibrio sp.]|nr:diaminopimelate epimerase [Micavibrio sp.]
MINFKKMHGLGNDFVIFDARVKDIKLSEAQIRRIADRKRGVGCDQIVILRISENFQETVYLDMYNADGSFLESCGNAIRCVADIMMREEQVDQIVLETPVGALNCSRAENGQVTVQMGEPKLKWNEIPLSQECDTLHLPYPVEPGQPNDPVAVSMGNPHCVFFVDGSVDDLGDHGVEKYGKRYETDLLFPNKTNVEFVEVLAPDHVRMRVWERGAGITDACGSGACAVAVAAIRRGITKRKMTVTLDGGDLIIDWPSDDAQVAMTGPVAYSFEGKIDV